MISPSCTPCAVKDGGEGRRKAMSTKHISAMFLVCANIFLLSYTTCVAVFMFQTQVSLPRAMLHKGEDLL